MPIVSGGGGGSFTGGTITKPLVVDLSASDGNSIPLQVRGSFAAQNVDFLSIFNTDTSVDMYAVDAAAVFRANNRDTGANGLNFAGQGPANSIGGYKTLAITAGALPTLALTSGVAAQNPVQRDVHLVVPVTFNPTAGAAATCLAHLSPDNVTFSTLGTETEQAGVALDGTIHLLTLFVPYAYWIKLTATNATIGTGTYY